MQSKLFQTLFRKKKNLNKSPITKQSLSVLILSKHNDHSNKLSLTCSAEVSVYDANTLLRLLHLLLLTTVGAQ